MKFTKKYDWLFRRINASIPLEIRINFKEWWELLGREVDRDEKKELGI